MDLTRNARVGGKALDQAYRFVVWDRFKSTYIFATRTMRQQYAARVVARRTTFIVYDNSGLG